MPGAQTYSDRTLGHYRILREAGRGGMSMVYEAEDTRIGRRVALKVLSVPLSMAPEQGAAMIARLKREARAIARLSHPNIVTIFDIGEEDGQHFIVMEFLEGLTLRERIAEGPLPVEEVASVLDGVASGLDAVHAAGIIHRDIKPSNVMLLPSGAIKLMDFGVARQHEDTMVTQAGSIVGSPTYMAPEQTEGAESSTATDMWSLGVTLYEMLAGRPPFAGENIPRILYQVAHEKAPALPQVTPAVRDVLGRALEKRPERRFRSGRQLAGAFRAALPAPAAVRPVAAAPAPRAPVRPRPVRARSASGRRPALLAAGLLLLVLLVFLPRLRHAPAPLHSAALPSAARPRIKPRPSPVRPVAVAEAVPPAAPLVKVKAWRRTRKFHHPERAPHRVAVAPSPEAARVTHAHPRPTRRVARVARAQGAADTARPVRRIRPRRAPRLVALAPAVPARTDTRTNSGNAETTRAKAETVRPQTARLQTARVSSPAPPPAEGGPKLTGTWHGTLTNHHATLVIARHEGNEFAGTMTVHTGGRDARVAVTGHVSRAGKISMRETHRLPGTAADAWDLGTETGQAGGNGRLSGTGTDKRGHSGGWSFSR